MPHELEVGRRSIIARKTGQRGIFPDIRVRYLSIQNFGRRPPYKYSI
jgi:hypothetical protein